MQSLSIPSSEEDWCTEWRADPAGSSGSRLSASAAGQEDTSWAGKLTFEVVSESAVLLICVGVAQPHRCDITLLIVRHHRISVA